MTSDTTSQNSPASAKPRREKRVWWAAVMVSVSALGLSFGARALFGGAAPASEPPAVRQKAVRAVSARVASIPLIEQYRGELAANVAELATQGAGRITEVRVNIGDHFKRGDVLAVVDASETRRLVSEAKAQVGSAEAAKRSAQASLMAAKVEASRADQLLKEQLISEQEALAIQARVAVLQAEIESAEAGRLAALARAALYGEQLAQSKITAPFDGAVAERYLDPGSVAQAGTRVLRVVQDGPLQLRFRASEQHLSRLKVDAPVQVTTQATGAIRHPGQVIRLSAEVSRTDRTIAVEGLLDSPHPDLRPGMYATVHVELGVLTDATLIPSSSLLERHAASSAPDESSRGVYVVQNGVARYQQVSVLGQHQDESAVAPLEADAQVVIFGQETLRDGDPVRVVESKP